MDRGAWRAAVHGVAESQARWKRLSARAPVHSHCCAAITTPISRAFPPSQTELPSLLTLTPRFPLFYFLITNMLISGTSYEWQRRQWQPTPVLLPGKSHGWRSLGGCSPWGREELDMTERLCFHFSLSCIGEGNGNPLQCSCLENPRDGGAWWAAIYGVAQRQTRLK